MAEAVTTDVDKLAAALVKFQGSVENVDKTQTAGSGSYAYSYADLGAIWSAIRKPLNDAELAVTQFLQSRDGKHWVDTTVWHSSGQRLTSSLELPLEGKKPQDAGSLITYYKRYTLGAALGIATEEDDDAAKVATQAPVKRAPAKAGPTDQQWDELDNLATKLKLTSDQKRQSFAMVKTEHDFSALRDKMLEKLMSAEQVAPPEQTA